MVEIAIETPASLTAIYESSANGHRLIHVRALIDELLARNETPLLYTHRVVTETEEFQLHLQDVLAKIDLVEVPEQRSGRYQLAHAKSVRWVVRDFRRRGDARGREQVLVLPSGDRMILPWLIARSSVRATRMQVRGSLLRPEAFFARSVKGRSKNVLSRLAMRFADASFYPLVGPLVEPSPDYSRIGMTPIADPVRSTSSTPAAQPAALAKRAARDRLRLPPDRTIVMVAGKLSNRKNVPLVLECFLDESLPPSHLLVLAGKPDPEVPDWLQRIPDSAAGRRIVVRLGLLTDDELDDYLRAADVLLQLYDNAGGSSGILSQAIEFQVPVIVYGNVYCEAAVREFRLGRVLGRLEKSELARAIASATQPRADTDCPLWAQARERLAETEREYVTALLDGVGPATKGGR